MSGLGRLGWAPPFRRGCLTPGQTCPQLQQAEWAPDFGPSSFVPSWGATATGARKFLIAFNINLLSTKEQAHRIALNLREQGRGKDQVTPFNNPVEPHPAPRERVRGREPQLGRSVVDGAPARQGLVSHLQTGPASASTACGDSAGRQVGVDGAGELRPHGGFHGRRASLC